MKVKMAFMFVLALVVAVIVAAPALADEADDAPEWSEWSTTPSCDGEAECWNCTLQCPPPPSPNNDDGNGDGNQRNNDQRNNRNPFAITPFVITQEFEQEAESGDVDQSFNVSQTGDNSNQTVGLQGVANTSNAQNQIGLVDAGGFDGNDFFDNGDDDGDFEFDNVGSLIEVSPTNVTSSDQQVNQTAVAVG
jgi:hypothetical protein